MPPDTVPDIPEVDADGLAAPSVPLALSRDELTQIALNLARNTGWPVFPCRQDKKPACNHGFKAATCDPIQINDLFRANGAALIGIPTGAVSGFDVLDVDVKHDAARAWLTRAEAQIPPTRTYRTKSGGCHLAFWHAEGVRNSQSLLVHGVDTRGDGGYIVFWFAAGYECLDASPLAPWPQWLLDALLRPPESAPAPLPVRPPGRRYTDKGNRPADDNGPQAMIARALDRVACAAEGHRHPRLRAAAKVIGGLLHTRVMTRDSAAQSLLDAVLRAGGERVDQNVARKTIAYGLDYGARRPLDGGRA